MAEMNTSKRSLSRDRDGSSPPLRKAKLDSNITDAAAASPVPTQELKYGTKLYYCRHCDMFALLKQKLASHKREMHNKKPPKKKVSSRSRKHTTWTRGQTSTINQEAVASETEQGAAAPESGQGTAPESGQLGAASEGEVGKADNVELTCGSEDSMDYDLNDDDRFRRIYSSNEDGDDDEDILPHDELYGPVF